MRIMSRGLVLVLVILSVASCKRTLKQEEIPAHIVIGKNYYTQFVIRYEKNAHLTTNYRRGTSIPVNTQVRLLNISSKTIEIELDNSVKPLLIKNVQKHTGDDVFQAFNKYFSNTKLNLNQYSSMERRHIQSGTVGNGMSKKAVIVAIGYPPITETINLDADTWVYWSGRFNKFNVNFNNGRVSGIKD